MLLVTGGSGFIGSNFIFEWINRKGLSGNSVLINLDKLTYASNLKTLDIFKNNKKYIFVQGDIADYSLVLFLLKKYKIQFIFNFAAESHVDRSISNPIIFVKNNVTQTSHLLEAVRSYWLSLSKEKKRIFRFVHISTDEVYGTLKYKSSSSFSEDDPYNPTNPYSASKAASNHLIKAYYYTYRLPILITNSSNNYGPYQHPEKLIPLIITSAISNKELPIYGHGEHIRDWLYVKDHCSALIYILKHGNIGEIYNINGKNEKKI